MIEYIRPAMGRTYGWSIKGPAGSFGRSSLGDANGVPIKALRAVDKRLKELVKSTPGGSWEPWPKRSANSEFH
ncbi:MAG: hypothetical protein WAS54_05515 [Scrofimicrobium sp.]